MAQAQAGKLPNLKTLLSSASTRRQTVTEQKTVLESIAQAFNLKLRKKKSKKEMRGRK